MFLSMSFNDFILTMAGCLLGLGVLILAIGIYVLISRVIGKEIKTIANQTSRLAQKGIAEDVAGLVGNASSLIEALNQLIKTSAGVGVFLVLVSFCLMAAAYGLVVQIH